MSSARTRRWRREAKSICNSEKYQIKVRDWNQPGNIKEFVARVNRIRRENPALHQFLNLRFLPADNDQILFSIQGHRGRLPTPADGG